ncbi:hypothetical protein [Bdellovibrio sp. HCB337]|uniref:hypothetical protein n=1 Tax=Bdellovibrio sp. HCB337 TaxID=3394358 RepID=UPI0039A6A5D4
MTALFAFKLFRIVALLGFSLSVTSYAQIPNFAFMRKFGGEFRGTASAVSQAANTTITITKPTGLLAQDVLYAFIWTNDYDRTASVPAPSGWTSLGSTGYQSNQYMLWVFRRVADGSEGANFSFPFSESVNYSSGSVVAYSGLNTSGPEDVSPVFSSGTVSTSTVTVTGLTTINHHSRVILCMIETSRASTLGAPSGFTQKVATVDATNAQSIYVFDGFFLSPQATGNLSTTGWNTSSNRYLGAVISLKTR